MAKDDDTLQEARERFAEAQDTWSETQTKAIEDVKFGRLGEQWPADIAQRRRAASRPCMTINRMPSFIRQVVNDGRQNRPQVKVRPADSVADPQTAEVFNGLIRHIEAISDADVAYDTALDCQASGGFGFVTIDVDYACDDSFDKEIKICTVPNALSVLWDAHTESHDSQDWDYAFISTVLPEDKFKKQHPKANAEGGEFAADGHYSPWYEGKTVRLAKYFEKIEKPRTILLLKDLNGQMSVMGEDDYLAQKPIFDAAGLSVVQERESKSYEIITRLITGQEILDEKRWRGSIIPVVPFWGDRFNVEGRWYSNSLIHDAMDAQRIFNFSRSTATELISLAPKVPFIGPKGSFKIDADKWTNVNTENYPYIEYDGQIPPQRQPFSGVPAGALQEAELANEDMKAIIGISNPSLGMPDDRVISGKAKRMERHESDTSTFHFVDNQHRGIRCIGRILLELIPQVYSGQRIVRILGADGKPANVPLGQPIQLPNGATRVYDLGAGKYDLVVAAGPSYSTKREEATDALTGVMQAAPQTAPVLGPMLVKMMDIPDGEKAGAMLATLMPPAARQIFDGTPMPPPGPPPEMQAQLAAKQAEAQSDQALAQQKAQHDAGLEQQKAHNQFQLAQQAQQNKLQIEQQQAAADIATMREKAAAEMQIMRERAAVEAELKRQEAQLAASLKLVGAAGVPAGIVNAPTAAQVAGAG